MKALKIMSIVGIILAALAFLVAMTSYEVSVLTAWGYLSALYLLAISIVGVVQIKN